MFRLSKKADYGLIALKHLAQHSDDSISAREIAREYKIPAELLAKILMADIQPENPASIQAFLVTLDAAGESAVVGLLEERPPRNPLTIAHDSWRELERRRIQRRLDACTARLRQPGLGDSETVKLQKEVLDLKGHLANVARLFSPPL